MLISTMNDSLTGQTWSTIRAGGGNACSPCGSTLGDGRELDRVCAYGTAVVREPVG